MKNPILSRPKGFTLIELLVVIAIIAVLAAAGFQAGTFALNRAKKLKALAVCTEIEGGVKSFFDDNGTLPVDVSGDTTLESTNGDGLDLLRALLNLEGTDPRNIKGVKYINIKQGKNDIDGLIYNDNDTDIEMLVDPWGGSYKIRIDGNFDEQIDVQPKAAASAKTLNGVIIAVWSDGADGAGADNGSVKDDVTTW